MSLWCFHHFFVRLIVQSMWQVAYKSSKTENILHIRKRFYTLYSHCELSIFWPKNFTCGPWYTEKRGTKNAVKWLKRFGLRPKSRSLIGRYEDARVFPGRYDHGPSQCGPYYRVRDLIATFTLNVFLLLLRNEEVEKLRSKLSGYI